MRIHTVSQLVAFFRTLSAYLTAHPEVSLLLRQSLGHLAAATEQLGIADKDGRCRFAQLSPALAQRRSRQADAHSHLGNGQGGGAALRVSARLLRACLGRHRAAAMGTSKLTPALVAVCRSQIVFTVQMATKFLGEDGIPSGFGSEGGDRAVLTAQLGASCVAGSTL